MWLLLVSALAAPPGLPWSGGIVHPGCIQELQTSLADSHPIVAAVDLEGCNHSNRYYEEPAPRDTYLRRRDPEGGDNAYFEYAYLGALANGVHVVRTAAGGGGTGVFQSLLFLRIVPSTVVEDGQLRTRQSLVLVGSETLGDRDEVTVTLSADAVTIRSRAFRGAVGYGPPETRVRRPR